MVKVPKYLFVWITVLFFIPYSTCAFEYENTADNPRLINLCPEQYRTLDNIERRIYNKTYYGENTVDRIERLELDLFNEIQQGNITQRLNTLRLESTHIAIRGTAMTPMMSDTFNSKYINPRGEGSSYRSYGTFKDDVGIIDGLIRLWWPNFYAQINEYRKYKEANFY